MPSRKSGCGCGTIVVLWFVGFALLRVCGVIEASWWYSVAPVWWPIWMIIQIVGWFLGVVFGIIIVAALISLVVGKPLVNYQSNRCVNINGKDSSGEEFVVIDAECVENRKEEG